MREILDALPANDPEAIKSRIDLRRINVLMGNFRWIERAVANGGVSQRVTELGAGDGLLAKRLAESGCEVTALDLVARPDGLPASVTWLQGDLFETLPEAEGTVVASLFLHHFEKEDLARIGKQLRHCSLLCFAEPLRSPVALTEGYALFPFVNLVTRHDMMVSIRAGFRKGELPTLLGLDDGWQVEEETTLLGAYRMQARRK